MLLELMASETDDPRFLDLVADIVAGCIHTHKPPHVGLYKINRWFDHKWLGFSGKVVGAVGSWRKQLTVPPFVANRIVDSRQYSRDSVDGSYRLDLSARSLHHHGPASENLSRTIRQLAPESALFWFCGDTATTGRGSLMGYIPIEDHHWPWFLALIGDGEWRIARRKGIHEYEVRLFREAGAKSGIDLLPSDVR